MRNIALALAVLAMPLGTESLNAQGDPSTIPRGRALGITVDRFGVDADFNLMAATFHVSALHPGTLSPEFAISIFPQALPAAVVSNVDLGGAINISLPHAVLLIRGGATGIFAFGSSGGAALPGAHYGVSLLIRFAEKSGFRFDVIRHVYFDLYEYGSTAPVLTVGIGITSLPTLN
jgi:hypothetical protein